MENIMKTKLLSLLVTFFLICSLLAGCASKEEPDDIIVLFTNDVHCGVDDAIGYAGLAAYKEYCESLTPYTTLVDCGDAIQGGLIGTVSEGEYIVDIMNYLEYDLAILGNHEFDFGMDRLTYLLDKADAKYLGCNITYNGSGDNAVESLVPYEIIEYGDTSVAYVGVSTPHTLTSSTPTYFMEDGEFVYSFHQGGAEQFYDSVQGYIDECLEKGADYVVLLTHLGDTEDMAPYSSIDLIENTVGVDAVLDGHAHSEISCRPVKNEEGNTVVLSSTGTKLDNIGQLIISASGTVTTGLISELDWKDGATDSFIKDIRSEYEQQMNTVVGESKVDLSISNAEGVRMVRTRETAIGNLCADAYRAVSGADIGLVNGGGVRADIIKGNITYADIIAVHPFGNTLCMIEATGQEIVDALEVSYSMVQAEYAADGKPIGENGEFLHISGMKLTVDTSIVSTVTYDENGMLASLGENRRVKDVMVMDENGVYQPIDLNKTYTVASHNYLLKDSGGNHDIFTDNVFLIDGGISDYEMLITYITDHLDGVIGEQYSSTEGRITVA